MQRAFRRVRGKFNIQRQMLEREFRRIAPLHSDYHNDFVCRISHPEPGMEPKKYFADLTKNFNSQISEIVDQIANLN